MTEGFRDPKLLHFFFSLFSLLFIVFPWDSRLVRGASVGLLALLSHRKRGSIKAPILFFLARSRVFFVGK